jgi:translation initiation factor RLI1
MPGNRAAINYEKCRPKQCPGGICTAALACSRKLIKQEAPDEEPMIDPLLCMGCGDCLKACPLEAIKIVNI